MSSSLAPHPGLPPLVTFGASRDRLAARRSTGVAERDHTTAAAETVTLVLDDSSPLPETPEDVETLAARLRGHISQLGAALPVGEPTVTRAQQLSSAPLPDAYVPSRVHLVRLAEATRDVIAVTARLGPAGPNPARLAGNRRPSRNTVRVLVFAVALITMVVAASIPRT